MHREGPVCTRHAHAYRHSLPYGQPCPHTDMAVPTGGGFHPHVVAYAAHVQGL